jgi:hypothetical protein
LHKLEGGILTIDATRKGCHGHALALMTDVIIILVVVAGTALSIIFRKERV